MSALVAKQARLLDEAKQAGIDFEVPVTQFESSVLGSVRLQRAVSSMAMVMSSLQALPDTIGRMQRALELLCECTRADSGHLFIVRAETLAHVASVPARGSVEPALFDWATRWWQDEVSQADLDTLTTGGLEHSAASRVAVWASSHGIEYRIAPLTCMTGNNSAYVGLVLLATPDVRDLASEYWSLSAAVATSLLAHGDVQPIYRD